MKTSIYHLFKKEISTFFNSPAAYITLIVFLLLSGWFSMNTFFLIDQSNLRQLFNIIPIVYLAFIPAITMNVIAKEKHDGTLEFLTTMPISDSDIVIGKFISSVTVIGVALLFTLPQLLTVMAIGNNIDFGAMISGYLGLILLGAAYTSVGVFSSSLSDNQIVSFIVSFMIIAVFFILDKILVFVPGSLNGVFQYLSTGFHFDSISKGVIDSRNLIYFASVITFFLLLSVRVLEMRKWR